jgi:hypothetical protein
VFQAGDVQQSLAEIDLIPGHPTQLADAQPMPVGNQNHCGVPVPVSSALACRGDHRLDFGRRQVFAWASLGIPLTPRWRRRLADNLQRWAPVSWPFDRNPNCPFFSGWQCLVLSLDRRERPRFD